MSSNTINTRNTGDTIIASFFNDIQSALGGDFVGRQSNGVPASGQNLGTLALPWGSVYANAMILNGSAIDTSQIISPVNRIISGKKRTTSNQPAFISPNGGAASFQILGASTNLVLDVNGVAVTVSTDITKTGVTLAPSSNNTTLINDTDAVGQEDTRTWGEVYATKEKIIVDTMGSSITALVGKFAAFKVVNGGAETEYFFAYVESTTRLSKIQRGYFYDSSINPKNRITFSNNDVITLMKIGYIFVENNATTVDISYTQPVYSFQSPLSPATGDYWYDLGNSVWKRYDGASFQIINRTFVGLVLSNSTATVAARCGDFYAAPSVLNTIDLEKFTTEIVHGTKLGQMVAVMGKNFIFTEYQPTWNITTDLAPSSDMYFASEQSSLGYYCYIKDTGDFVISDISPYFRSDLGGKYHPHNPWRCVGQFFNDASNDISVAAGACENEYNDSIEAKVYMFNNAVGYTSPNPIPFDTVYYDNKGMFNTSSYFITVPADGIYEHGGSIQASDATQCSSFSTKNSNADDTQLGVKASGSNNAASGVTLVKCKLGDQVSIYMNANLSLAGNSSKASNMSFKRVGN